MRRGMSWALAAGVALAAVGCRPEPPEPKVSPRAEVALRPEKGFRKKPGAPATPEREAVLAVLTADLDAYNKATEGLSAKSQPSEMGKALKGYLGEQAAISLEECPQQFRDEFQKFRKATKTFASALARLPDDYAGTTLNDHLKRLFRQTYEEPEEQEKIKAALGGDVCEAVQKLSISLLHMHRAAMNFGIDAEI